MDTNGEEVLKRVPRPTVPRKLPVAHVKPIPPAGQDIDDQYGEPSIDARNITTRSHRISNGGVKIKSKSPANITPQDARAKRKVPPPLPKSPPKGYCPPAPMASPTRKHDTSSRSGTCDDATSMPSPENNESKSTIPDNCIPGQAQLYRHQTEAPDWLDRDVIGVNRPSWSSKSPEADRITFRANALSWSAANLQELDDSSHYDDVQNVCFNNRNNNNDDDSGVPSESDSSDTVNSDDGDGNDGEIIQRASLLNEGESTPPDVVLEIVESPEDHFENYVTELCINEDIGQSVEGVRDSDRKHLKLSHSLDEQLEASTGLSSYPAHRSVDIVDHTHLSKHLLANTSYSTQHKYSLNESPSQFIMSRPIPKKRLSLTPQAQKPIPQAELVSHSNEPPILGITPDDLKPYPNRNESKDDNDIQIINEYDEGHRQIYPISDNISGPSPSDVTEPPQKEDTDSIDEVSLQISSMKRYPVPRERRSLSRSTSRDGVLSESPEIAESVGHSAGGLERIQVTQERHKKTEDALTAADALLKELRGKVEHLEGCKNKLLLLHQLKTIGDDDQSGPTRPPRPKRMKTLMSIENQSDGDVQLTRSQSTVSLETAEKKVAPPKPLRKDLRQARRSQSDLTGLKSYMASPESTDSISCDVTCTQMDNIDRKLQSHTVHECVNREAETEIVSEHTESKSQCVLSCGNVPNIHMPKSDSASTSKASVIKHRKAAQSASETNFLKPVRKAPPPPIAKKPVSLRLLECATPGRSRTPSNKRLADPDDEYVSLRFDSSVDAYDKDKRAAQPLPPHVVHINSCLLDSTPPAACKQLHRDGARDAVNVHEQKDNPEERFEHAKLGPGVLPKPLRKDMIQRQAVSASDYTSGSKHKNNGEDNIPCASSNDNNINKRNALWVPNFSRVPSKTKQTLNPSGASRQNGVHSSPSLPASRKPRFSSGSPVLRTRGPASLIKSAISGSISSSVDSASCGLGSSSQSVNSMGSSVSQSQSSSSEPEDTTQDSPNAKKSKTFYIAQEICSSEKVFVNVLKLINEDFRNFVVAAAESSGKPVIPEETLNLILKYLPQLYEFNKDLLHDLEQCIQNWDTDPRICYVFVKKGAFLKLYTEYIREFEQITSVFEETVRKNAAFAQVVAQFEMKEQCAHLALKHYMLKPIQRIPQYRLLLQDYLKHLTPTSSDYKDTVTALRIVQDVALHANESMRYGDNVQCMLEIQHSLIGQFEVIQPGRVLLKKGELSKLSRKEMQPRMFFLFSDVLLYTTPIAVGYKLKNVLLLAGMKVSMPRSDDFQHEFSIISVQRSFTLAARTSQERADWLQALQSAISEHQLKRSTFNLGRARSMTESADIVLGMEAPVWIPDARVTMCMLCTCEFSITWRRHHCRACGKVVCGSCADNRAPLAYLNNRSVRVCDMCLARLTADVDNADELEDIDSPAPDSGLGNFLGLKERFFKIRRSFGKTQKAYRPAVLTEVHANDKGSCMSGYLKQLQKNRRWKRFWFVLKLAVLYSYKASEDSAARESIPLLGYEVKLVDWWFEHAEPGLVFQLKHTNLDPLIFRTESKCTAERWILMLQRAATAELTD